VRAELPAEIRQRFEETLQKSYQELFAEAARLEFSPSHIAAMRRLLEELQSSCTRQYRRRTEELERQLRSAQAELKRVSSRIDDAERKQRHCQIQNLRATSSQARVLAEHAIPVAFENKKAKLELVEKWPGELERIKAELAAGTHLGRRWGM